jgi:hypothetical protein
MPADFNPLGDLSDSLKRAGACRDHPPLRRSLSVEDADTWHRMVNLCSPSARVEHLRWFALNDLFFLLVFILHRPDLATPWGFNRCAEVQEKRENTLDFWSRGSWKSSISTFGLNIQDILRNPEETIGIFSHTRPAAKKFLRQIKTEFETNEELKQLFPDVLYKDPKRETKWSEDDGIVVKRKSNRGEGTVEAWGLVDGQPTGKHFSILDYDDVIPDYPSEGMIPKITEEWELSLALSARPLRFRVKGTFYDISDTYQVMMQRGFGHVRIRCAVTAKDCPFTPEDMAQMRNSVSPRMWALQFLLDPDQAAREEHVGFDPEWLRYYSDDPPIRSMNIYVVVDPAGKSKESNSQFALWVVGLLPPKNIYILDAILDKLDLGERGRATLGIHRKYYELGNAPLKVGYETYGMQGDVDYLRELMQREHYVFPLIPLSGTGKSKDERIELLIPDFRAYQIWFPTKGIIYRQKGGSEIDIVKYFVEREYRQWPFVGRSKDLLDSLARIKDPALGVVWPRRWGGAATTTGDPWGAGATTSGGGGGWMSG